MADLVKFSWLGPITEPGGQTSDVWQRFFQKFQDQLRDGFTTIGSPGLLVEGSPTGPGGTLYLTNTGVIGLTVNQPTAGLTVTNSGTQLTGNVAVTIDLANDLAAVEGLTTAGLVARLGDADWVTRTINGTTNRISVTSPLTGDVTFDIHSSYAGQASINTLGVVTSGVWAATPVAITSGGTGQSTATDAINALLPDQAGQANKVLRTDGLNVSWTTVTVGTVTSVDVTGSGGITSAGGPITTSGTISLTLDADLDAIAALSGTSGLLRKTAANTWSLDTNSFLTGNQTITLSGDASGSGTTAITTTLATVNSSVGSFGSSTAIPSFTVNEKGLITVASANAVIAPAGTLTGSTLAAGVTASSLTSVGTLSSLTLAGALTGVTDLTTTGNTTLGNAATDTLNVGNGGLIKDGNGNVGIGMSPASTMKLDVSGVGRVTELVLSNAASTGQLGTSPGLYSPASGVLALSTNGAERLRVDASGNLYVGVTTQYGSSVFSLNGGMSLNGRSAANPGISEKDDTDTGVFWPTANTVAFATGGAERFRVDASGHTTPGTDNTQTLGSAAKRWSTVYAGTGTINTSDLKAKEQVRNLTQAELSVARDLRKLIRAFKFKDAVVEKGEAARLHIGVIAQEIEATFAQHGLDADRYGLFCRDEVDDETRYAIRYDELLLLALAVS